MSSRYACLVVPSSFPVATSHAALLDLALRLSPRVEAGESGTVCLDLGGLGRLHPDERRFAEDLAACAEEMGLPVRVAIASTRTVARIAATTAHLTVVPPGGEAAFLDPLSINLIHPLKEIESVLARWGIRTLGELAALPDTALIERLGEDGRRLQRQAQGEDLDAFIPYRPPSITEEVVDLDWPIELIDELAFVLSGALDRLVARLSARGWAMGAVHLTLGLADRSSTVYDLSFASPLSEGRAIVPLVVQQVRSSPPAAPIERIIARAGLAAPRVSQSGLFSASRLSPERLGVILARLEALVGRERVGSPGLRDLHRPDAFTMQPFTESSVASSVSRASPVQTGLNRSPVLRRVRPPLAIEVEATPDGVPARILGGPWAGAIRMASGPWRLSGEWWTDATWQRDEWDAELRGGRLVRLVLDRRRHAWCIEGVYD